MDGSSGQPQLAAGQPSLAAPRGAAIAGVLFAVLMATSIVLVRLAVPSVGGDIPALLAEPSRRTQVRIAVQLAPFAGIAFLWFIGVFRNRLGKLEDQFFATVFLGSGLLFVASLFSAAAFSGALVESVASGRISSPNSDAFYLARQLTGAFQNVFAIKMAGVFIMSSSTVILRTGVVPRAIALSGYFCAAVLLLVITSWPWIALLFPAWMLLLSATILLSDARAAAGKQVASSII
jgi:hypothetical protein